MDRYAVLPHYHPAGDHQIEWLFYLSLCLLLFLPTPLFAQDNPYNLPSLSTSTDLDTDTTQNSGLDPMQKSLQGRKRLEQSLKQYTRTHITNDSVVYLQKDGIKLETEYRQGDIQTLLETHGNEEITFTFKVSF